MESGSDAPGAEPARTPGVVEGQARDVQARSDTDWFTKTEKAVLAFRVQRFDELGNLERLVPVEMRGMAFEGSVHDGDRVRVTGRYRQEILRAKKIENLDDGSVITARGLPSWANVLAAAALVAIAAFIGFVGYQLVTR